MARACLAAVGCQRKGQLGNLVARRELLERANDPGTDSNARRGLRLLLHGSRDHRTDDTAQLWVSRHGQHPAWERLWAAMHQGDRWTLVPEELANAIPGNRWGEANIAEIDAETLIRTLDRTDLSIKERKKFTVEEREEILSRIENEEFWRRLTLHTTLDGHAVSASGERVYLAPQTLSTRDALAREATLIVPKPERTGCKQAEALAPPPRRPSQDRTRAGNRGTLPTLAQRHGRVGRHRRGRHQRPPAGRAAMHGMAPGNSRHADQTGRRH